jgi:hypothetical protein
MPNSESYWFPAKRYGWGWGAPVTWQGWVVLVIWAAALAEGLFLLRHHQNAPWLRLGYVLLMCILIGVVCYLKGEPPKWRWGGEAE